MSLFLEIVTSEIIINNIFYGKKNIYFIMLMILSISSVLYLVIIGPIIYLDENQILYIFSTSAQVIAGLYGLTLAGYTFFEPKLKDIVLEDNTYYDHIESLKKIYYRDIRTIGIITILSIIMCIFSLSFYRVDLNIQLAINLTLTLTMSFVITSIISIVQFSIKLLDPNKLSQIGKKIKSSIEKNKSNKIERTENIESYNNNKLLEFMKNYNELESTILDFAKELEEPKISLVGRPNKAKPRIVDALKILTLNEIIRNRDIKMIDTLRQYRNALVHGNDFNIDKNILDILKTYNEGMKNIFNSKSNINDMYKAYEVLRTNVNRLINNSNV